MYLHVEYSWIFIILSRHFKRFCHYSLKADSIIVFVQQFDIRWFINFLFYIFIFQKPGGIIALLDEAWYVYPVLSLLTGIGIMDINISVPMV